MRDLIPTQDSAHSLAATGPRNLIVTFRARFSDRPAFGTMVTALDAREGIQRACADQMPGAVCEIGAVPAHPTRAFSVPVRAIAGDAETRWHADVEPCTVAVCAL